MVLGAVGKFGTIGVILLVAILFFRRAFETGSLQSAGSDLGGGIAGIGSGIQTGLSGLGTGLSQLFNPLFTFLDFGKQAQSLFGGGSNNAEQPRSNLPDTRDAVKSTQTNARPREANEIRTDTGGIINTSVFGNSSGFGV